jgi:hypothetical protein
MKALPVLLLSTLLLPLAACEKAQDAAAEKAVEAIGENVAGVEVEGDKISYKNAKAEVSMDTSPGQGLPPAFSENIYLPEDFQILHTTTAKDPQSQQTVTTMMVSSSLSYEVLYPEMHASLKANGWVPEFEEVEKPLIPMFTYVNGSDMLAVVFDLDRANNKTIMRYVRQPNNKPR